ncbi:MAG: hypothetical protein FWF20_06275 [Betaproteobacteria bacterium]|nr:hypothetical protein [Betaproteobacteria bacterium]MCL2886374.1 hypothetical protein [Betaproteobacteria bacterium]
MLEILARLLIEFILTWVFYWPGWAVLRVLTLGRYPPRQREHNREFVAVCGFVPCLIAILVIAS